MGEIRLTVGYWARIFRRMVHVEPLPPLGDLELEVLDHLWAVGEADVTETHAVVGRARGNSVNTVGSALERLHRKRLVHRTKVSHAYRYRPAIEREAFHARRMVDAVGGAQALADLGVLTAFVDAVAESDRSSLDQLSALIAERKRKKR
jgi:predicted transcriptional regulator